MNDKELPCTAASLSNAQFSADSYSQYANVVEFIHSVNTHQVTSLSENGLEQCLGLDEFELRDILNAWAGISPEQVLEALSKSYAKQKIERFASSNDTTNQKLKPNNSNAVVSDVLDVNHNIANPNIKCITPQEYKAIGDKLVISYAAISSPFGRCFIANSNQGVCKLAFFDKEEELETIKAELHQDWSLSVIHEDQKNVAQIITTLFQNIESIRVQQHQINSPTKLILPPVRLLLSEPLLLKGTTFQMQVWQSLLRIGLGCLCSYSQLAELSGKISSVRAVASAVAGNPIAYLIPCHRVIRKGGEINQYRWGSIRKQALVAYESLL